MNSLEQDEGMEPTDGEYVVSSRNGCPDHFRLLVQRYQRPLFAYLSSRLGNHLEAEEAAQESFVRAFTSLKKLRKPESFYAWLMGIAGRVLKEQFRARERRQRESAAAETLLAEDRGTAPEYPLEEALDDLAGEAEQALKRIPAEERAFDEQVETALSRAVKKAAFRIWERRPVVETTVLRI